MRASVRIIDSAIPPTVIADIGYTKIVARSALMEPGGATIDTPYSARLFELLESRTEEFWVVIVDDGLPETVHGGRLGSVDWDGALNGSITLGVTDGDFEVSTSNTLPVPSTLAHPVGSTPRAAYTYTRPSQQASASLYELVNDQLNASAPSYRQRPIDLGAAALASVGGTLALSCKSPYEPLLDTVRDWSLLGGLVTDFPLKGAAPEFEMLIRVPSDVGFRLSEANGTPIRWSYSEAPGTLHIVNAGGKGEGVDRPVAQVVGASDPRWGVTVERFVKASSAVTQTELNTAGLKALDGKYSTRGLKARAVTSRMGVEFRRDYQLGDRVSAVFNGVEYLQLITAVETEWTRAGKSETIETGEPPIVGVTLGRQAPAAALRPTEGLSVGSTKLTSIYEPGDSLVNLAVEVVYARGEASAPDQATWAIERRVDSSGSWSEVKAPVGLGSSTLYYVDKAAQLALPAFVSGVEYRGRLDQSGETTVYSSVLVVGEVASAPQQPTGLTATARLAGDSYAADLLWDDPFDVGVPAADSIDIRFRMVGASAWTTVADATDPTGQITSISHGAAGGDEFEYQIRFVSDLFDGAWSASATFTYPTLSPPTVVAFPSTTRADAGAPVEWTSAVVDGNPTPTRTQYRIGMGSTPDGDGPYTFVSTDAPFTPAIADVGKGIIVVETWTNSEGSLDVNELSGLGATTPTQVTTTGGFFTTADGGFFTTSDGGFFTVDDS